ncbi:MATE family efflux transporter [Labilibacter sediminis]|nr:MATE family efflux transporter [Labilibacter sediminis]
MHRYFKKSYYQQFKPHYLTNLKLALPVVLSQAGQMTVNLADTLMVGRLGATELAAVSFANSIFIIGFVLSIGLSIGVTPMVGKAHGAGNSEEGGYWLKQGMFGVVLFAIIQAAIMFSVALFMYDMGQEPEVVKVAIPFYLILVASTIPVSVFMVFKQFAEGITNTRIAMIITLTANIINIILNYIFIFGKLGVAPMGVQGAGWATLIARIIMPTAIIIVFIKLPYFKKYKQVYLSAKIQWSKAWEIIKVGFPIGGQMVIEVFAFSMGAIMMGWISKEAMAAHQIVIAIASLTYMMSNGLGAAATIKVSNYRGAVDWHNLKLSAYAIVHKVIIFMSVTCVLFITLRHFLPGLFTKDSYVLLITTHLMIVAGIFQVFDGLQVVWLGILRGIEDVKIPSVITFITWIVLALPICYICAFILKMGAVGIWIGYLSGLMISSAALQYRFNRIYHQLAKIEIIKK